MVSTSGNMGGSVEDVFNYQIEEEELEGLAVSVEGENEGIDDRWCLVGRKSIIKVLFGPLLTKKLKMRYSECTPTSLLARMSGFTDNWVRLIYGCLSTVQYNIVSSGYTLGTIVPSRGLWQGDPISPYLSLICAEGFSALIKKAGARRLVGNSSQISILKDPWLVDDVQPFVESQQPCLVGKMVQSLMKVDVREWDAKVITDVLTTRDQDLVRVPAVGAAAMTFCSWWEEGLRTWDMTESLEASMILRMVIQAKTLKKVGALQPHEVEAIGIKEVLSWIKDNGWPSVIVESDCLRVVSDLQKNKSMASPYGHIISYCKALFVDGYNVSFNFVKRPANKVAHALAPGADPH
uniref:RNase H type-1 domain-containing protein n=1 Tax=Cannabis sativa TaxID=3483 RepID=A0A803PR95_CANSA